MRALLDTQAWLWMDLEPERLTETTRLLLEDSYNDLLFSAASVWEIGLKYAKGKLPLPVPPRQYVPERMRRHAFIPLAIVPEHAILGSELPRYHRDPFDRLLVAQAQIERLPIITADPKFRRYDVAVIEA